MFMPSGYYTSSSAVQPPSCSARREKKGNAASTKVTKSSGRGDSEQGKYTVTGSVQPDCYISNSDHDENNESLSSVSLGFPGSNNGQLAGNTILLDYSLWQWISKVIFLLLWSRGADLEVVCVPYFRFRGGDGSCTRDTQLGAIPLLTPVFQIQGGWWWGRLNHGPCHQRLLYLCCHCKLC